MPTYRVLWIIKPGRYDMSGFGGSSNEETVEAESEEAAAAKVIERIEAKFYGIPQILSVRLERGE